VPKVKEIEILIIGGGPAGLSAASAAADLGASVLVLERDGKPGGQLVKQTHKFFGSKKQYAGDRGYQIGNLLIDQCQNNPKVEVWTDTTALGIYEDGVVTAEGQGKHLKIKPQKIIVATGASEKMIAFPNNDMPGIFGAGAVQTLMNVHGIVPGKRVLMIGAGNIGLIVSYQLMQAGVEVAGIFIVDASYSDTEAVVRIPFEYYPVPQVGEKVVGLNRAGEELGTFEVSKVQSGGQKNKTYTVWLVVPQELAMDVRSIRLGGVRHAN